MVLTFQAHRLEPLTRVMRWVPTVLTWLLLVSVVLALAWSYLANPQPSPYGMCYAARGRPMPCELVNKP